MKNITKNPCTCRDFLRVLRVVEARLYAQIEQGEGVNLTSWRRRGRGPASCGSYSNEKRQNIPVLPMTFSHKVLEGVWGNFSKEVPPHNPLLIYFQPS